MNRNAITSKKILFLFLLFYLFIWAGLPSLLLHSILPDSAENIALSHAYSWSYSKHPPLGMFIIGVASLLFKNIEVTTYFTSAICLVVSMCYIYKTSRMYLETSEAVASTILSSLSYYFVLNFALQYNQNVIMLPFWVATVYFFIKALDHNSLLYWCILSVVCALGVLASTKYLLL